MILKYGSYAHANNEAALTIDRTAARDGAGRVVRETERWTVAGVLQGASQAALTVAIEGLKEAYAEDGKDLILYLDDGQTPTSHALRRSAALAGPRVVQKPSFPQGKDAEYSTFRSYQLQVEADFAGDETVGLVDFQETVEFEGGGETWAYLTALNGPPQRQTLARQSVYRAVQRGEAVGRWMYPAVPSPLWPAQEHRPLRKIRRESPQRKDGAAFENWKVSWQFVFESAAPLLGQPQLWRNG